MQCYYLVATTTNRQTKTVSIIKPAPPVFFSIQCCHEVGKAPSFALVLWIDDSCYGTFVDRILTLRNVKKGQRKVSKPLQTQ